MEKRFEILDMRTTDNPYVKKMRQKCEITVDRKSMADVVIKPVGRLKFGSAIYINRISLLNAIENADEPLRSEILEVLTKDPEPTQEELDEIAELKRIQEEKEAKLHCGTCGTELVDGECPNIDCEGKKEVEEPLKENDAESKIEIEKEEVEKHEEKIEIKEEIISGEKVKYQLTDDDKKVLAYDIKEVNTKNKITRYWNRLTQLADKLELDYTNIEEKDCKELRKLFDNLEV